ncbi:hypothetical protein [Phaeospirillum tilakii]|uniref:Uncharacterized protein n=1 Tax=Phaeospirillum tilakii TaxID=741673 RepID=A0ABW5C886_9PROT
MTNSGDKAALLDLLARWQAFSVLQQNAFAFLAAEAVATGREFEEATEGAAGVLAGMAARIGGSGGGNGDAEAAATLRDDTFAVIGRLQAADRSRQGLEQVASVLETFRRLEAELVAETRAHPPLPPIDPVIDVWSRQLGECITLSDWRRRFTAALAGRDPGPRRPASVETQDEDLFS